MNIPLDEFSGSKSTKELHDTIKAHSAESSRQTQKMVFLTWVMTILTIVMVLAVGVRIYLAMYPPPMPTR